MRARGSRCFAGEGACCCRGAHVFGGGGRRPPPPPVHLPCLLPLVLTVPARRRPQVVDHLHDANEPAHRAQARCRVGPLCGQTDRGTGGQTETGKPRPAPCYRCYRAVRVWSGRVIIRGRVFPDMRLAHSVRTSTTRTLPKPPRRLPRGPRPAGQWAAAAAQTVAPAPVPAAATRCARHAGCRESS